MKNNTKFALFLVGIIFAVVALGQHIPVQTAARPAALPAKAAMLPATQTATQSALQPAAQFNAQTAINRIRTAEDVIERVTNRIDRLTATCNRGRMLAPEEAESCITNLAKFRSLLPIIRAVAASGDETEWNKAINIVHKFENDTERQLVAVERILR